MSRKMIVLSVFVSVLVLMLIGSAFAQEDDHGEEIHWGYEGDEGPENWGNLSEDWVACGAGMAQSPVDITDATEIALTNITFNYGETAMNIFNNGHTIQINVDEGSSITYNEIEYQLLQFHFHHPSEHTVNGEPADMELHFVHQSENGNLAVVGVMLMAGDEMNEAYAVIFDNLPVEEGEPDAMGMSVTLADLLPADTTFYTYNGSLTTPPCTEIVRWLVVSEPIMLSSEQIEAFAAIYDANARPIQALNDRDLLVDSDN